MASRNGKPSLGFAAWSLLHVQNVAIEILDHALLAGPVEVLADIEASYFSSTSGILVPPSPAGNILLG
jgi:hypothetical protein